MAKVTVNVELSELEAKALIAVVWNIGGDPKNSARKHIDSIRDALTRAGISHGELRVEGCLFFPG